MKSKKPQREINLTLGIFFDGTGNNAVNTDNMLKLYTADRYDLNHPEVGAILAAYARKKLGVSGNAVISYTGYYTNIHWLSTLYKSTFSANSLDIHQKIYIDGIGTEAGKPDSILGHGLGISDTGVLAKTNKAIAQLPQLLSNSIQIIPRSSPDCELVIKSLQFDIFGFSRGAAAARHFANRIQLAHHAIILAIQQGTRGVTFNGTPTGKTRFIGIFDTVAAIGTPVNGLNLHSAKTGSINLLLRPGVAEKVFHLTAANECRFNFALNSVNPAWPELALPGAHSDIGGGYLPVMTENLFLTRPGTETVPLVQPGEQTRGYLWAITQLPGLTMSPSLAPLLRTTDVSAETWFDDRLPSDRYGQMQKRSYAALTIRGRKVRNDWSRVALRVMLEAAQDADVMFDPISETFSELQLSNELVPLCQKALMMGKATRLGHPVPSFSQEELNNIGRKYIHCSANWNTFEATAEGIIHGGASPSELIRCAVKPRPSGRGYKARPSA